MFTRNIINEITVESENGITMGLKYYLTSSDSESPFSNEALTGYYYGISIDQIIYSNSLSEPVILTESVKGFTYVRSEALNLIKLMAKETVTPLSLIYIIDDYITANEISARRPEGLGA